MALALQIVVLLLVLISLVGAILCIKNWHWGQMVLALLIWLSAIGTLILGLEVYRIHRNLAKGIPRLESQIADVQAEIDAFRHGTRDQAVITRILGRQENGPWFDTEKEGRFPPQAYWSRQLHDFERQRGRVWRGVAPAGPVDAASGRAPIVIPAPRPHGLEKDAVVHVFDQGEPNAADPTRGPQYLGEFRVVDVNAEGALLESASRLDARSLGRLNQSVQLSQGPQGVRWSLYETMPTDQHGLFAGWTEEELRQRLPAASVEQYLRHGTPATEDDDEFYRAGFDEAGNRVGPENADQAAEWRYDRPLRDYALLFAEMSRQRVGLLTQRDALTEDIAKLKQADVDAKKLTQLRTQQKQNLAADLGHLEQDRQAIESLLAAISKQLSNARQLIEQGLRLNAELAASLYSRQIGSPASFGPAGASGSVLFEADPF